MHLDVNLDDVKEDTIQTRFCFSKTYSKENISLGNSMISSDIWHKCHEWYFKIVLRKWNLRQFWNITSGIYAKYHVKIMLLFVYTITCKSFVIFTCRYFKLSWNTTPLSQSHCRNFSCSSIRQWIKLSLGLRSSWESRALQIPTKL